MWPWYWVSIDREMIFWITFNGIQPHSERVIYDTLLVWPWPSWHSKLGRTSLISPFLGWLKPLFLSSGDVCPGFQSQGAPPHLHVCHPHATESSDSPLVWHLLKSWQPALQLSHSHPHTCKQVLVGLETRIYCACCRLPLWDQADALPTELCWLGFLVLKLDLDIVCNSMQKTWST